jgi:hypothetical protein
VVLSKVETFHVSSSILQEYFSLSLVDLLSNSSDSRLKLIDFSDSFFYVATVRIFPHSSYGNSTLRVTFILSWVVRSGKKLIDLNAESYSL